MAYAFFRCPHCKDDGTKMLIQFSEEKIGDKPIKLVFHCKNCDLDVEGELIHLGEGVACEVKAHADTS